MDVSPGNGAFDEEESADSVSTLDVTPRVHKQRGSSDGRKWLAITGVVVLIGALGLVVFNGLTDAATFYYNVDEAVQKRDDLGDQRFRMQGNVIEDTIAETDVGVEFTLAFGDEEIRVVHQGDPPELFKPEIPVIIEGSFEGEHFASDEILIKHDSTYEEENDARLREAREDAERRAAADE